MGSLRRPLPTLGTPQQAGAMKLLLPSLLLLLGVMVVWAAPPVQIDSKGPEGRPPPYYALANYMQQKRAQASAADRELLAEYLAGLGAPDYPEPVEEEHRAKRRWWGNKYKDNKSYGFWISALNKAGNIKRGKRSAFLPAMGALVDDHNPLQGSSDYSDVAELVPNNIMSSSLQ